MNGIEIFFIILGGIATTLLLTILIKRISAYYIDNYNYSIWAGTALIILAAALAGYGLFGSQDRNILLIIFAAVLLLFVIFLDIRRTKIGAGLLALLVQIFLAAFFVIIILITLLFLCLRLFRGKRSNYSKNSCNRSIQTALSVFAHSFIPW